MKPILAALFMCSAFITQAYGQMAVEKKATNIDDKKKNLCQIEIEAIESIPLKYDSICWGIYRLYFDEKNNLRKFCSSSPDGDWNGERDNLVSRDGSGEYSNIAAYFDQSGNLVYIINDSGCNCDQEFWYYYLYERSVVDFLYLENCDCCDPENIASDSPWRFPHIENSLDSGYDIILMNCLTLSLGDFIHTDSLLKRIQKDKY